MSDHQQFVPQENDAEGRLRALLANHALGIVEVTIEGEIALANRTLGDWLGVEPAMLVGREFVGLLHPEDRVTLARQLERLAAGAIDSTTIAHRMRRAAGTYLWVRSTWSARRSDGGVITHLIAIVDDIAQQREDELVRSILEESIRGLEERRRYIDMMIGGLPAIAWRALPSGLCEYLSPQWAAVTGLRDGGGLRWLAAVHPDDRGRFAAAWGHGGSSAELPKRVPLRLRHADGHFHRYEAIGAPVRNEEGEILAWTGVLIAAALATQRRDAGDLRDVMEADRAGDDVATDAVPTDTITIDTIATDAITIDTIATEAIAADGAVALTRGRLSSPPGGSGYHPA